MTGVRVILPIHIPDTLEFRKIELVGQYAVHFEFSDNHRTGIYSFEYLRELCPCEICAVRKPKSREAHRRDIRSDRSGLRDPAAGCAEGSRRRNPSRDHGYGEGDDHA